MHVAIYIKIMNLQDGNSSMVYVVLIKALFFT